MASPSITSGSCFVLFAYDIAFAVNLDAAATLHRESEREVLSHKRRTPSSFQYRPTPVRIVQTGEPLTIGGFSTSPRIEITLFDFGAASVSYRIPLSGSLDGLLPLSDALYENAALLADSRKRIADLLWTINDALDKPHIADFVEDYAIFQIERIDQPSGPTITPDALIQSHRLLLAGILRAEKAPLSESEVQDALSARIAYTPGEASIIDWNASILLLQEDAEDICAVLEYTNVELLEMRHLDDQLDDVLDRSRIHLNRPWWRALLPTDRAVRRVAELQMDSTLLFEGVNNALKLVGDQYLSRLYKLAADRLHLPEWDASILRKLETAESIYQKLSDRQSTRRMEALEWIIIILIAVSTILAFI